MNDYFIWNGVKCTDLGIHVSEQPPVTLPEERVTFTDIPGRNGSLTQVEGDEVYKDITLTATCFITDTSRIGEIGAYLKGAGTVTFANRPGGFYYARITNQIPFEKVLRGRPNCTFEVNFRCKPFWHMSAVEEVTITASSYVLVNPGNVHSEPVITVYGSGDITLMVNDTTIELEGVEDCITIDSTIQEAYKDDTLMNERMSGEFPLLKAGNNLISWTGDVASLVVQPNYRCL